MLDVQDTENRPVYSEALHSFKVCCSSYLIFFILMPHPAILLPIRLNVSLNPAKWSYLHAFVCLGAACTAFAVQHAAPLLLCGVFSFGLLITSSRGAWTPRGRFGGANLITLTRLAATLSLLFVSNGVLIFILALLILIADGFDGWVARRHKLSSEFGEYFDKETDALFLLILCALAFFQQKAGAWIILPGLLRYLFVIALALLKPDFEKEYRSRIARVIYVVMISAMLGVFILPAWLYNPMLAIGTTGLFLSFAHYFRWLFFGNGPHGTSEPALILKALLALVFLNSLLLLPSLVANWSTSDFFPVPDPSRPLATLTWDRGWYDYVLYLFVRRPNQDLFRICADLVLLVTALLWWMKRKAAGPLKTGPHYAGTAIPWPFTALFIGLIVYEIYDAVVFQFFHRHGLLYEDIQYSLNLYYIAVDALRAEHLFGLILLLTGIGLFSWLLPALYRTILAGFSIPAMRTWGMRFSFLFWPIFIGGWFWYGPADERPTVRSIAGKIVSNSAESLELAATISAIEALPVDRIYDDFDRLAFRDKPNIHIFMLESYGRVLQDNAYLQPAYDSLARKFQQDFKAAGWHSATRFSTAPVSGGLSWLSMNSVLSGLFMKNRTFYTRYLSRIDGYPHLVQLLQQQGYYTLTLQPPNKARLGLPIENHYHFDKTVYFDDLHYTGPPYSIWVIPDQYSLGYTHEHYLPRDGTPYFFFFETATTHAPWTDQPPYVDDWRTLNQHQPETAGETADMSLIQLMQNSMNNRFMKDTPGATDLYRESMFYDLRIIRDYILEQAPENSLFIILGDHQPPLIPSTNYDTPIHVISRNAALVDRFEAYGFDAGMRSTGDAPMPLTHAGVYSMLIEILAHHNDHTPVLPARYYRPEGVSPSILTTSD